MSGSPVEWQLLLAGARLAVHDRAPRALSLRGVSWPVLLELADLHGLVPHLHRLLHDRAVPDEIRARLASQAGKIALHNLHMTGELHRLLDALGAAGIDAICFKGPALATVLYGGVGLRQFSDLDLLVPREKAQRAIDLLRAAGYYDAFPDQGPEPDNLQEVRLLHDQRRIAVEIHWGLLRPITGISPTLDGCWERAHSLIVAGRPATVLGREDRVLLLATHGATHGWSRLGWLCDLARLIRTDTAIDWATVARRARTLHCERMVWLALELCAGLLEAPVPAALRAGSGRDRAVPILARYLTGRCQSHPARPPSRFLPLAMRERARDQLRMAALTLFDPTPWDHAFFGLPGWLWPVTGALRPVRLLVEHGLGPLLERSGLRRPRSFADAAHDHLVRTHREKSSSL